MADVTWEARQHESGLVHIDFHGWKAGAKARIMLASDQHTEHSDTDRSKLLQHMDDAKSDNSPILFGGDTFCAMGTRNDPRRSPSALIPELQGEFYLDKLKKFVGDFYMPYRKQIVMIGKGNHESKPGVHCDTDLTADLVDRLNSKGDASVFLGNYCNWIMVRFYFHDRKSVTRRIFQFHGAGGDAPMSHGVIEQTRMAAWQPDADVIWCGHIHKGYAVPIARHRLTVQGREYDDTLWLVRTPSYKNERQRKNGYAVEKNHAPRVFGCAWLEFECRKGQTESAEINMRAVVDV